MNVFIYINFKTCKTEQPFLHGWKCGKIEKETMELINTKLRAGLFLKNEEMGGNGGGHPGDSQKDRLSLYFKVRDGNFRGGGTILCLDLHGGYMTTHLSKLIELRSQKSEFCSV